MSTESTFTNEELTVLKEIAGRMIPASPEAGLPGANDEEIISRAQDFAAANTEKLKQQLHNLLAAEGGPSALVALDETAFDKWFDHWAQRWPQQAHPFFALFMPILLRAYYQDSRVLTAYDRRPGPPFPEGYVLIDGDWSLLDVVRERPPFFRS